MVPCRRYRFPRKVLQQEALDRGQTAMALQIFVDDCRDRILCNPHYQKLEQAAGVWRKVLVTLGILNAFRGAVAGAVLGSGLGLFSARRHMQIYQHNLPNILLFATLCPPLRIPLFFISTSLVVGVASEVVVLAVAHAYVGSLMGFGKGCLTTLKVTVRLQLGAVLLGLQGTDQAVRGLLKLGGLAVGALLRMSRP
eukprot:jgi/Astpho2/1925/Aster-00442